MSITWVIERDAFDHRDDRLIAAARAIGHGIVRWDDMNPPRGLNGKQVVFHGSLNAASRVFEMGWNPGSWCNVDGFSFSAYAEQLRPWLLNTSYEVSTVRKQLGVNGQRFIRPDSPLKQFAGCVVDQPTAMQLGLGFYHDDLDLRVIVSPVLQLGREWRFVIVSGRPVSWCCYDAITRRANDSVFSTASASLTALELATKIAATFNAPDPAYVLDIVETTAGMRVVEANPFSGADLYKCPCEPIVSAVAELLS